MRNPFARQRPQRPFKVWYSDGVPLPTGFHPGHASVMRVDDIWSVVATQGDVPHHFLQRRPDGGIDLRSCSAKIQSVLLHNGPTPGLIWLSESDEIRFEPFGGTPTGRRSFGFLTRWRLQLTAGSFEKQLHRYGYRDLARSASGDFAVLHHPARPEFPLVGLGGGGLDGTFLGAGRRLWTWIPAPVGTNAMPAGPVGPFLGDIGELKLFHSRPAPAEQGPQLITGWIHWSMPVPHFHLGAGPDVARVPMVAAEDDCRAADATNRGTNHTGDVTAAWQHERGEPDAGRRGA